MWGCQIAQAKQSIKCGHRQLRQCNGLKIVTQRCRRRRNGLTRQKRQSQTSCPSNPSPLSINTYRTNRSNTFKVTYHDCIDSSFRHDLCCLVGELLLKTVQCGNYEELKILLSVRSVDVNYRSLTTGQTALMHCSSAKIAELLLLHGAGVYILT